MVVGNSWNVICISGVLNCLRLVLCTPLMDTYVYISIYIKCTCSCSRHEAVTWTKAASYVAHGPRLTYLKCLEQHLFLPGPGLSWSNPCNYRWRSHAAESVLRQPALIFSFFIVVFKQLPTCTAASWFIQWDGVQNLRCCTALSFSQFFWFFCFFFNLRLFQNCKILIDYTESPW